MVSIKGVLDVSILIMFGEMMCVADQSCAGTLSNGANTWSAAYRVNGGRDKVDFTVTATTTGWVGIGFSDDPFMVRNLCWCYVMHS